MRAIGTSKKKLTGPGKETTQTLVFLHYPLLAKLRSVPASSRGLFPGPAPVPQSRAEKGRFGGNSTVLITDTEGFGKRRVGHTDS